MNEEEEYFRDIAEMRSMMERSSKFMSLSGLAGVMAGIYALAGAFIAYKIFYFSPVEVAGNSVNTVDVNGGIVGSAGFDGAFGKVIILALLVLILAVGTAVYLSGRKADKRRERLWNASTRRLLANMAVPLVAGGLLILVLIAKGLIGFIAPFSLLFYGLALYNASKFTYDEVKSLGLIQIGLGLIGSYFTGYGLVLWALGFGVVHIVYGIYMHYRYER